MILSASTALVDGPVSYRRLRNFTYAINLAVTLFMLALLLDTGMEVDRAASWACLPRWSSCPRWRC